MVPTLSHLPRDDVERPVKPPRGGPNRGHLSATHQRCGAWVLMSSRRGPDVNTERPQPGGRGRTVLTSGWRLLLVSPCAWRWRAGEPSTTRRSTVDRRTATMMYASRNRSKAIRSWLPLNLGARDALANQDAGLNTGEDRICCGGAPASRGELAQTRRRSRAERGGDHGLRPRPPSRPRETRRVPGRWPQPRPSARSCGPPVGGSGATDGLGRPRNGPRSRAPHPLGAP